MQARGFGRFPHESPEPATLEQEQDEEEYSADPDMEESQRRLGVGLNAVDTSPEVGKRPLTTTQAEQ